MIIKLNREVKKLTKEQVEVLKTLGACIEVRDKRYFIEARVDNDTSLLDIAPIWNWEFAGNMRDYYICEGESKYTPTLKDEFGDTEEVTDGLFKEGVENIASYYKVSPEDI